MNTPAPDSSETSATPLAQGRGKAGLLGMGAGKSVECDPQDRLFQIQCGQCRVENPLTLWLGEQMTPDVFTCPSCGHAFRRQAKASRQPWEKFVECVPVTTR